MTVYDNDNDNGFVAYKNKTPNNCVGWEKLHYNYMLNLRNQKDAYDVIETTSVTWVMCNKDISLQISIQTQHMNSRWNELNTRGVFLGLIILIYSKP